MATFLQDLDDRYWGWVVYRTTFTAESKQLFKNAVHKLDGYIGSSARVNTQRDVGTESGDAYLYHMLMAKYQNIILEDPTLDQASFDNLRTHFSPWLASQTEFDLDL